MALSPTSDDKWKKPNLDQNANNSDDDQKVQFFEDVSMANAGSRRRFIAKVYVILFIQLCVTAGIGFLIRQAFGDDDNEFIVNNSRYIYFGALAGAIACLCVMSCCPDVVRPFPRNYIFLTLVTGFLSITTGFAAAHAKASDIAIAVGITASLFFVLTLIAVFVKKDFTGMGKYLFIAFIVLFLFGIAIFVFGAFTSGSGANKTMRYLSIGLSVCFVILSSFYIVYDTQRIVGGENRKFTYSTNDHCFAAISLYLDLLNMFLSLLNILSLT